ncbi:hypothetical protein ACFFS2_03505 [Streptomyces aurantiacus]|uniref:ATP-binding protein n=1 Tax=Streptomyces aurantiacus TaxID=47760 RepID=A0A7G1PBA4_9ACTN|nr:hypothetical protein [Streptomyces aurantiacus]BCL31017.1 hypothetical protein GCM10017557_58760 [Streptomyces aurantiacus]
MTISDAASPLSTFGLQTTTARQGTAVLPGIPGVENSIEFRLGPGYAPAQSIRRARGFAIMMLPTLLAGAPNANVVEEVVLTVLTELVDVTARHRASIDLSGRISHDGDHVLITIGEMDQPLPDPEEEPGLFLVRRLTDEIGQYRGDEAGHVTWVSVPVRSKE